MPGDPLQPTRDRLAAVTVSRYDTPEAVLQAHARAILVAAGEDPDEPWEIGGGDMDGAEVTLRPEQMLEGITADGRWGWADAESGVVHYWLAPTVLFADVLHFFAHELAHLAPCPTHEDEDVAEELRAEYAGVIAVAALEVTTRELHGGGAGA